MTNSDILGKLDQLLRMTTDIQAEQRRQADQIASLRADVARIDGRTTDSRPHATSAGWKAAWTRWANGCPP